MQHMSLDHFSCETHSTPKKLEKKEKTISEIFEVRLNSNVYMPPQLPLCYVTLVSYSVSKLESTFEESYNFEGLILTKCEILAS